MTYRVLIAKYGESQPFWSKIVPSYVDAERVARKNQRLIDRHGWNHVIAIKEDPHMLIKGATVDGSKIEVYAKGSGHHRYWAKVNHRALLRRGGQRVRTFATVGAAWTVALKEAETSPRTEPARVVGYSNFGGGGPFAPMASPRQPPKRRAP